MISKKDSIQDRSLCFEINQAVIIDQHSSQKSLRQQEETEG